MGVIFRAMYGFTISSGSSSSSSSGSMTIAANSSNKYEQELSPVVTLIVPWRNFILNLIE